jgi:hypothetical protein
VKAIEMIEGLNAGDMTESVETVAEVVMRELLR